MQEKGKSKGGRPKENVADKVNFKEVERMASLGLTDSEIAYILGYNESTLNRWKADKQFLQVLKNGKCKADEKVIDSLFKRATGYSHPDVHVSNYQGIITVTPITKHYPPDTMALMYWLNNRRKEDWRYKQTGDFEVPKGKRLVIEDDD